MFTNYVLFLLSNPLVAFLFFSSPHLFLFFVRTQASPVLCFHELFRSFFFIMALLVCFVFNLSRMLDGRDLDLTLRALRRLRRKLRRWLRRLMTYVVRGRTKLMLFQAYHKPRISSRTKKVVLQTILFENWKSKSYQPSI